MATFDLPEGIIPPLLTPLTPDQTVDTDALRQLIRMHSAGRVPSSASRYTRECVLILNG